MNKVTRYIADEIADQVAKILKDSAMSKLMSISKQTNLSDSDIQKELRTMGFEDIANDSKKYDQFRNMAKLPMSDFKARFARLLIGVGSAYGKEKLDSALKSVGAGSTTKSLSNIAYGIFRGSAKDFAEKTEKNRGFKNLLDNKELMQNIAKSLREKNN